MKTRCLSLFISFCLTYSLAAQELIPFQLEDAHAKEITATQLIQLKADDWYCYDRRMRYDGSYRRTHPGYQMVFQADGTLILARYGSVEKLRWSVVDNKLLHIYSIATDPYPADKILGAYAIYKISSEELIMAKSLTSDFNYKQILYFYRADKYFSLTEVQDKPKVSKGYAQRFERASYKANFTWSGDSTLSEEENLRMKIKADLFMKQQPLPADFADWNLQQLRDYFN